MVVLGGGGPSDAVCPRSSVEVQVVAGVRVGWWLAGGGVTGAEVVPHHPVLRPQAHRQHTGHTV